MTSDTRTQGPVLVVGAGIGGMAAALALAQAGFEVDLYEQAAQIGEIGAGIQLGPNAFAAADALGCGPRARALAVYNEVLLMMDAVDGAEVARMPVGDGFRERFGNPYAVIHRADIHLAIHEAVHRQPKVRLHPGVRVVRVEIESHGVALIDAENRVHRGRALIGADGVRSVVRERLLGDAPRVSGHVVYRAVVPSRDMPDDLRWNAAALWAGPDCHLVHYPLRGGEQYNVVVTFHSRQAEQWGVTDGSKEEVESYFQGISPKARQLIDLPKSWRRWATADKEPIGTWVFGRATILGDAAHPTTQYMAQGACMAMEDAVTLGEALRVNHNDWTKALALYQKSRVARTARIVLSGREMGRLYHAKGVERLVRNDLWKGRTPERFYDAMEWLYGWNVKNCLAQD